MAVSATQVFVYGSICHTGIC